MKGSFVPEKNHSHFKESLNRFHEILADADRREILSIQDTPLPTGIRLNSLKVHPKKAIIDLAARYDWQIIPVPFCDRAWAIKKAGASPGTSIEHRMGHFYLQDLASMVPGQLFDFDQAPARPLILDMAASPGGKTTHLIDRCGDQGFVIANDASKGRIPALRSVLSTWGGVNQIITQYPGESFGAWYPETFDIVLLDSPCSMENLRPTANHPLRETTTTERDRLQERQIQLLSSGLMALKIGGQLVYATCSLAPEEDEAVLDRILKAFPNALRVENASDKLSISAPALHSFNHETYHPDVTRALRLWPHQTGMSGFFCALVTKINAIPSRNQLPPSRDFTKTDLLPLKRETEQHIKNTLHANYGLNLEEILERFHLSLNIRYDQIFLIPKMYLEDFSTLPYEYIGMPLGQWDGKILEPSHEFISRFGRHFTTGKIEIPEENIEQWITGRDIRYPDTDLVLKSKFLLVTDESGRNLGLGKLLPKRLRNMLPRSSR
jgi:16S rRNA (cytosine1407-C5)-methyltransferase